MTTDTDRLLSLARECGHWNGVTVEMNDVGLVAYTERIRQDAMEQAARVCEWRAHAIDHGGNRYVRSHDALHCAQAIRMFVRGEALLKADAIRSSGTRKGTAHV